jgi:MFS family permease
MGPRERYARVLGAPHVRALLLAEIPMRLPIGINGLAIVLFLREHTGSYAAAGAVAAAFGAALGLSSPLLGRIIDHRGLRQTIVPLALAHAVAMAALVACGLADAPVVVLAMLAAAAGAFLPPLGSITRAMWPRLLQDEDPGLLPTALAMEGVLIELIFVAGPLLTAVLSALIDPAAALILSPVLLLGGLAGFLMQPPVRTWVISEDAGSHGPWGALRSPGIQTLVLCTLPMGFCFGAMEVTLPAFSEDHGARGLAGVLVAVWSLGSAAGGLLYGAWHWSGPTLRAPGGAAADRLPAAGARAVDGRHVRARALGRAVHRADADGRQPDRGRRRAIRCRDRGIHLADHRAGGRAGDRQLVGGRGRRVRRLAGRVPGLRRRRGAQRAAGRIALAHAAAGPALRSGLVAPAALGPLVEMLDTAEGVADAMLTAMAHDEHALEPEHVAAQRATPERVVGVARRHDLTGLPGSALDDPRHDVLQAAENRLVALLGLGDAEAVVISDRRATPGAVLGHRWHESNRARGGPRNWLPSWAWPPNR